jgi:hypothetical protein
MYLECIALLLKLIKRKELLLQKLCSLYDSFLLKTIFLTRLLSYFIDDHKQQGFIPDIIEDSVEIRTT